ncbi:MAG: NrfD/PsrC family molybdoenzyme membrane anchor subunit [Pseudomonadota bacterium]
MEKDIREDIAWAQINKDVIRSVETPRKAFWVFLLIAIAMLGVAVGCEVYMYIMGIGVANMDNPHVWGLYIATFIFWIGMSHSGTLLSAILHLMHADWRKPIYRFAEAMTTFSLMTAVLFVAVHLGRVWQIYYVAPYPNERWAWPNFQSPLLFDAFAIFTYLSSSVLFLYIGMIPDLAILRDNLRAGWRKSLYTVMSLGWEGTDRQWRNFRITYLTLACFLIPLAVSVHSIVASDFAVSQQPGWHITSFPPYFVAGALYSGCAAIITLFIMLRYVFKFEEYMTLSILKKTTRLTFAIAMVWTYLNLVEYATVWYGHDQVAKDLLLQKAFGPYAPFWWSMNFCGSIVPLLMAFKRFQTSIPVMFAVSLLLNLGMWLERWMIVSPTFSHGWYPWTFDHDQWPSFVQWGIVFGSFGWFTLLFMVFCKVFPSVSMYEVKEMVYHRTLALKKGDHAHDELATKGAH